MGVRRPESVVGGSALDDSGFAVDDTRRRDFGGHFNGVDTPPVDPIPLPPEGATASSQGGETPAAEAKDSEVERGLATLEQYFGVSSSEGSDEEDSGSGGGVEEEQGSDRDNSNGSHLREGAEAEGAKPLTFEGNGGGGGHSEGGAEGSGIATEEGSSSDSEKDNGTNDNENGVDGSGRSSPGLAASTKEAKQEKAGSASGSGGGSPLSPTSAAQRAMNTSSDCYTIAEAFEDSKRMWGRSQGVTKPLTKAEEHLRNKYLKKVRKTQLSSMRAKQQQQTFDMLHPLSNLSKRNIGIWTRLQSLVLHGIPNAFRGEMWYHLSGAAAKKAIHPPDFYERLTETKLPRSVGINIDKDIDRTFPGEAVALQQAEASWCVTHV